MIIMMTLVFIIIIIIIIIQSVYYLEVIEWRFSYGPPYLTLECNIGFRLLPESNVGPSAREGQYCMRSVTWANIALMNQIWSAM